MFAALLKVRSVGLMMVSEGCRCVSRRPLTVGRVALTRDVRPLRIHVDREVDENSPADNFGKVVDLDPNEVEADDWTDEPQRPDKRSRKSRRGNDLVKNAKKVSPEPQPRTDPVEGEEKRRPKVNYTSGTGIFRSIMTDLKMKKIRNKKKLIVLEGKRLIMDAIASGHTLKFVFFSRLTDVEDFNLTEETKLYRIEYDLFKLWGTVVTPCGVMGVMQVPEDVSQMNTNRLERSMPLTVICDNIREPGNMGAILRVVTAVGCDKLILTKGCVNIWESKVLRAGAGAHFRLPILRSLDWSEIHKEVGVEGQFVVADVERATVQPRDSTDESVGTTGSQPESNSSSDSDLPTRIYSSVDFAAGRTVIVIGGETHGVSEDARRFVGQRNGVRVTIPMDNGVESLNTSVALGILAYEVRRQRDAASPT